MAEVCRVWTALEGLSQEGVIEIKGIKNRFRGEPTPTRYRDINISVAFEGHVCEIQIQLAAILEIKEGAHKVLASNSVNNISRAPGLPSPPSTSVIYTYARHSWQTYELIRSLNLEDELFDDIILEDVIGACSPATLVVLGVLRFVVAVFAFLVSCAYIQLGFLFEIAPDRPFPKVRSHEHR